MNRLVIAAVVAVVGLTACGGPLEEEQQGPTSASQTYLLNTERTPPVVPTHVGPTEIVGREPVLELDVSNGRLDLRLNLPPLESRALHQTHLMNGCGCRH